MESHGHPEVNALIDDMSKLEVTPPFLRLPGELRNRIYEDYATATAKTPIKINKRGFAVPVPLMSVCRQVNRELPSVIDHELAHKAIFEAEVLDFDFSHVLKFLERIERVAHGKERELRIKLAISERKMVPLERMRAWASAVEAGDWLNEETKRFCVAATIYGQLYRIFYRVSTTWKHQTGWYCNVDEDLCGCLKLDDPKATSASDLDGFSEKHANHIELCEALIPFDKNYSAYAVFYAVIQHHRECIKRSHSLQGLPGNVRKRIYQYYTSDLGAARINNAGCVVPSPLLQASLGIRLEMELDYCTDFSSRNFEAVVSDFKFDHVTKFLERLIRRNRRRKRRDLPTNTIPRLVIHLQAMHRCLRPDDVEAMRPLLTAPQDVVKVSYSSHVEQAFKCRTSKHGCSSVFCKRVRHMLAMHAMGSKRLVYRSLRSKFRAPTAVPYNYAGVAGVSKQMRVCTKTVEQGPSVLKEQFVQTTSPRPAPRRPPAVLAAAPKARARMSGKGTVTQADRSHREARACGTKIVVRQERRSRLVRAQWDLARLKK